MSSMVRRQFPFALLFSVTLPVFVGAVPAFAEPVVQTLPPGYQPAGPVTGGSPAPALPTPTRPAAPLVVPMTGPGGEWDEARARLRQSDAGQMAQAIERWKVLSRTDSASFGEYAGFLLTYPGFPFEEKLRRNAEKALEREMVPPAQLVSFFDRDPPLTNPALARYALALAAVGRADAVARATKAWRGGAMGDASEAAIASMLTGKLTPADQDARMDALLWAGANDQAARQLANVSPAAQPVFAARLAALTGNDPDNYAITPPAGAETDPGWIYNRARQLRRLGAKDAAASLLVNRGPLSRLPLDAEKWIDLHLDAAKDADSGTAIRIAAKSDDGFAPGSDISRLSFGLRDQYTSLMWLGASKALAQPGNAATAARLFWRYGSAARTPQTRSKGFYWAGRAMLQAGETAGATQYFAAAAMYPDQFYGMLSLERMGSPLPPLDTRPTVISSRDQRAAFNARPITQAVREVSREADWPTAIQFFREICEQADSEADHVLVAELARELGRRDMGVILGQTAHIDGHGIYRHTSFPLVPVPEGSDWTMVHAISRQESQFAMNAVSHAGARGLMQLMPGTARMIAVKMGLPLDLGALMSDASYNIRLGNETFRRNMDYYGGSYPLAVAAYNAGPGNVNKWLRANGDPRTGEVNWIDWIERIPFSETRGYVQHVLENAVVYEAMNPDHASYKGTNPLSHFLGKRTGG